MGKTKETFPSPAESERDPARGSVPIRIPSELISTHAPETQTRILLVDDDPEILLVTRRMLSASGYHVDEAESGEAAMRMLTASAYDVLICDLWLPGVSGIDVLKACREIEPETVVILMSASPTIEAASQAIEEGAAFYVSKHMLRSQLTEIMGKAKTRLRSNDVRRKARTVLDHVQHELRRTASEEECFGRARESLRMAFQPIFNAATGALVGHEALLRPCDPAYSGPVALLEAAEALTQVVELGRTVRSRVAEAFANGLAQSVFVNLHALDLSDPELGTENDPLTAWADQVILELTERREIRIDDAMLATLDRLRARGFRIAIDDLGAGYSSLSSVLEIEPEVVKLDASLVRGIHLDARRQRLVGTLVRHYRETGIRVVAEAVEVQEELDVLVGLGCDMIQGFLLGRPAFFDGPRA